MSAEIGATVLGYPRIGPRRELKKALESYWAGKQSVDDLQQTAAELRAGTRRDLAALDSQPTGTFSFYDHVLDVTATVDAVPARFRPNGRREGTPLEEYFAAGRAGGGPRGGSGPSASGASATMAFRVGSTSA